VLPDYPKLKADIGGLLKAYFRKRVSDLMPGSNEIPRHMIYEGRHDAISRQGEEVEQTALHAAEAKMVLTTEDLITGNAQALFDQIHRAAEDMARQQFEMLLTTVEQSCNSVGNVINNAGKPFTPDTLLEGLRMVDIPFSADGTPQLPTFFMPPNEQIRRAQQQAMSDPEWQRRFHELIEEKRLKWRDSEAARVLAE